MDDVRNQTGVNDFFNRNVRDPRDPFDIPQMEKGYPEPSSHGVLPVYGLLVAHARNVKFDRVVLETIEGDARPAILLMDVDGARFTDVEVSQPLDGQPLIELRDVRGLETRNCNFNR